MSNLAVTSVGKDCKNDEVVEESRCVEVTDEVALVGSRESDFPTTIFKRYMDIDTFPELVKVVDINMFARSVVVGRVVETCRRVEGHGDASI